MRISPIQSCTSRNSGTQSQALRRDREKIPSISGIKTRSRFIIFNLRLRDENENWEKDNSSKNYLFFSISCFETRLRKRKSFLMVEQEKSKLIPKNSRDREFSLNSDILQRPFIRQSSTFQFSCFSFTKMELMLVCSLAFSPFSLILGHWGGQKPFGGGTQFCLSLSPFWLKLVKVIFTDTIWLEDILSWKQLSSCF